MATAMTLLLIVTLIGVAVPLATDATRWSRIDWKALASSPAAGLVVLGIPALAGLLAVLWSL